MMSDKEISTKLLEKTIEYGLAYVGDYLRGKIEKTILIADNRGYMHYPEKSAQINTEIEYLIGMMPQIEENQYYYENNESVLVYPIGRRDLRALVLVKNVLQEEIVTVLSILSYAKLAIKNYIYNELRLENKLATYQKNFLDTMFLKNEANVKVVLEKAGVYLEANRKYAIGLIKVNDHEKKLDAHKVRLNMFEYSHNAIFDPAGLVYWHGFYVFVVGDDKSEESITSEPIWKKQFEDKYKVKVAISYGRFKKIGDMQKSYNEARVAMTFQTSNFNHSFVQHFDDLGIYTMIFSHDFEQLTEFCMKTVAKLMVHDSEFDADLFITLRALLRCNFNLKGASEQLFVHVNTVRYRYERIEQLLEINLSDPEERTNLYVVVRVGAILEELGFMKNCYIGNIVDDTIANSENKIKYPRFGLNLKMV